jgi:hypothetical protein
MPIVLTHIDLNTCNILSDSDGHITKVVDWAEVENLPFGMELYRVEDLIGGLTPSGYRYRPYHADIRKHFWECVLNHLRLRDSKERAEMRDKLQVVSDMGILLHRLGFKKNERDISSYDIGYMEALLQTKP